MSKKDSEVGLIYIMSNKSYSDLVKVGYTTRPSAKDRADELSGTSSIPTPFAVEYSVAVENPRKAERLIHDFMEELRVSSSREFFEESVQGAIDKVNVCLSWEVDPVKAKEVVGKMDSDIRKKHPDFFNKESLPSDGTPAYRNKLRQEQRNKAKGWTKVELWVPAERRQDLIEDARQYREGEK